MNLLLTATLLGSMIVTSYRSVPEQTDNSPFITSIGEHVCKDGVAASQDLLLSGKVKYGDWVYIEEIGFKRINDTMNKRHVNRMDVWVGSFKEEKAFHERFGNRKLKIYLITPKFIENSRRKYAHKEK